MALTAVPRYTYASTTRAKQHLPRNLGPVVIQKCARLDRLGPIDKRQQLARRFGRQEHRHTGPVPSLNVESGIGQAFGGHIGLDQSGTIVSV